MAIAEITERMNRESGLIEEEAAQTDALIGEGWRPLKDVLGLNAIPPDSALVIMRAIAKMASKGEVSEKAGWQALEFWAADYLAAN